MPAAAPATRRATGAAGALALATGLVLLAAGCGTAAAPSAASPAGLHGVEPDRPVDRPSFVLTDTAGERYDFRARTAGAPTLLFFGYTSCPDECYTAMADISTALRTTASVVRDRVRVVFVTTDPERDDAGRLRQWLDAYSPHYVGLRGTPEQVEAAQRAVGAPVAQRGGPQPTLPGRPDEHVHAPGTAPHTHSGPLGYRVDHTSVIFAFDASDRMPVLYRTGSTPSDIAADLPFLARKEST